MAHAGIKNTATLLGLRLLLGAFEAGFVPTVFYYLGTLYPHYMLGFRLGLFAGMVSLLYCGKGHCGLMPSSFPLPQHSRA
jgi:MFS family permease